MANFLEGYEDVNARIKRFRNEFPMGRVEISVLDKNIDLQDTWILIEARVYRTDTELVPAAVDIAFERKSAQGVNKEFWAENASTSAIGRAIGLLTPSEEHSGGRPTRQDMEKVERFKNVEAIPQNETWSTPVVDNPTPAQAFKDEAIEMARQALAGAGISEMQKPKECSHGVRLHKSGTNKKGGQWEAWFCPLDKEDPRKCNPVDKNNREWA